MFGLGLPASTLAVIIRAGIKKRFKENNLTPPWGDDESFGMLYNREKEDFKFEIPAKSGKYFNYEDASTFCSVIKVAAQKEMKKGDTLDGAKLYAIGKELTMEIFYTDTTGAKINKSTKL